MVATLLTEALHASSEYANKLDDLVAGQSGFPIKTDGDWMLASQWAMNASIHNSILTLFRDNLPSGAFSLLRPVNETLVRVHLIAMNDPEIIEQMRTDKFRTKFFKHPEQVDKHFDLGGDFKSMYDGITNFMHSTVHMGLQQTKRQFTGTDLTPNYPENEIIAVIVMSTVVKFMVTARVIERFQTITEQEVLLKLLREFTALSVRWAP
jgi:hypothetical protein